MAWLAVLKSIDAVEKELDPIAFSSLDLGSFVQKKKCSFTRTVSIGGRIIAGTWHSDKMNRTIVVRRNYLHFVKKYQRYEKRHSNIPAHISPCFRVREGDHVIIGQCRPLPKTVTFNVFEGVPAGSTGGTGKKAFTAA
nr:40S ribosomal protein S11-like [Lolium perenne]